MDAGATLLVLRRELLTNLRSGRSALLMLAFMTLMTGMALLTMVHESSYSANSYAMRNFFTVQACALLFVALAVVPSMAAVSLCHERETGNYDLLAATLLPDSAIVLGKFAGILTYFLLFCVAVFPFMGLVYFYAGLDVFRFFDTLIFVLPLAPFGAAVGIWVSGLVSRSVQAIPATFITMASCAIALLLAGAILQDLAFLLPPTPPAALTALIIRLRAAGVSLPLLAVTGLVVVVAVLLADVAAQYPITRALFRQRGRHQTRTSLAGWIVNWRQRTARDLPLIVVPDGANPFGYRDLYGNRLWSGTLRSLIFCATGLLYLGAFMWYIRIGSSAEFYFRERAAGTLIIPPLIAISLSKEREETTKDMYRMTSRPGAHLLIGKLLGLCRTYAPILFAILACKSLIAVFATVVGPPATMQFGPVFPPDSASSYWLDLLLLPVHFVIVACVASMGAAFPKTVAAAIVSALACTLLLALPAIAVCVGILISPLSEATAGFLMGYGYSMFFLCWITFVIAAARMTTLWEPRE